MHKTPKMAIGEKTECTRNFDGIIEPPRRNIRLANYSDTRHGSARKSTFHCSEGHWLVIADHLGLLIAGRNGNKNGRDQPNERSCAQIELSLGRMDPPQGIKSSHSCDYERAGHEGCHLV